MLNHPASDQWEAEKAMEVRDVQEVHIGDSGDVRGLRGLREQASRLLARLEKGRELSEKRAAETGQRDPMKFITGRSALDSAITATRGMIARMDALLAELNGELKAMECAPESIATTGLNGSSRRSAANGNGRRMAVACTGSVV